MSAWILRKVSGENLEKYPTFFYQDVLHVLTYYLAQVEEIHNFDQDDLLTEEMHLLDTHAEVFVWVGQCVDPKEKQTAFEIGQVICLISFASQHSDSSFFSLLFAHCTVLRRDT